VRNVIHKEKPVRDAKQQQDSQIAIACRNLGLYTLIH
jgi:hypothetical protein